MGDIKFLSIFLVLGLFGCNLCQQPSVKPTDPPNNSTTTTQAPNITTTTTTTTTTTPVPPKTTTVKPTPTPPPNIISGNVTENNYTCIRYEFTATFAIKFQTINNETKEAHLLLPLDVVSSWQNGTCTLPEESFTLISSDANSPFKNLTLIFGSNVNSVFLDSFFLEVKYDNNTFPNITTEKLGKINTYNATKLNSNLSVEKSHSFFCANLTIPKPEEAEVRVIFSNLRLQAFMDKSKNGQFSTEHNCLSEINDVVPIAVGAALTGLVVIVMIAYFIGRRRSRRLAYQSV